MKNVSPLTYDDIDWNMLWQNSRKQKSWSAKGTKDWDQKATSFSSRNLTSPYASLLLSKIPLDDNASIIDIGCGPGTLALPLAKQVAKVTALDYSAKMIDILQEQAKQQGLDNIDARLCSWEDDWDAKGICPADIAIASRSLSVDKLGNALDKLNHYGTRYVFISDRVAPSPFDPDAFAAIGRPFNSGPDYIYTVNMLYTMGIHPHLEILELDREIRYTSYEDIMDSYRWMFEKLTDQEERQLRKYLNTRISPTASGDGLILYRAHPPRWALIWWQKHPH